MSTFDRGSRYRNVRVSPRLNAHGEFALGVNLRVIPIPDARVEHVVHEHDRLDLLGHKYYDNASRWWQIADANPHVLWPPDLVGRDPLVDQELLVSHPEYFARVDDLVAALAALGPVVRGRTDFEAAALTVRYSSEALRTLMTAEITGAGFVIQSTFPWAAGAGITAEAFTLQDPSLTLRWNDMLERLRSHPAVERVTGEMLDGRIRVTINSTVAGPESVRGVVEAEGFALRLLDSKTVPRVGQRVLIPPDRPLVADRSQRTAD